MTSPAIQLARECGYDRNAPTTRLAFQGFSIKDFYARAQAQALRDAAEKVDYGYGMELDMSALLRRMADELERKE